MGNQLTIYTNKIILFLVLLYKITLVFLGLMYYPIIVPRDKGKPRISGLYQTPHDRQDKSKIFLKSLDSEWKA